MPLKRAGHLARQAAVIPLAALTLLCAPAATLAEGPNMDVIAQSSSGPMRCEIRKSAGNKTVELTGVVASETATSGHFQYKVVKSGASGASNINQANKFTLAAGAQTQVGQVRINLDAGAHLTVEFEVTSDDGASCVARASL